MTKRKFRFRHLALAGAIAVTPMSVMAEGTMGSTLEDFFTAALDYSPRLKISEQRKAIGEARYDAAKGQLLPQISAQATLTDNKRDNGTTSTDFDGERYSVQLRQVLFNWEAFSARRQAISEQDRSEAEYYYELSTVLTEVAEKYFNVLQAQGEVSSNKAELDAVKKQLSQIEGQYEKQLAQITDLLQAQASVAAVESDQIRLQSDLDLAKEALRSASGLGVGNLNDLADNARSPSSAAGLQEWVAMAYDNNYQIKAKQHAIEAAREGIERRKGTYFPTASLIVERQDSDVGFDNAPIRKSETTYFGVDINVPIWQGGTRKAGVREARSLHAIAESELEQIKLDTSEIVRSAYLQYKASESAIKAAQSLYDSTTKTADAMAKGFELGTVTNVDVLNAIRDQFQAERRLQEAKYDSIKFYLILKREAGDLSAEDMVEISSLFTANLPVSVSDNGSVFASTLGY
ncbi:MAG: TolC family outer membrane protein [Pseudomonadales bacterium]